VEVETVLLVVDDDPVVRNLIVDAFADQGYRVHQAANAAAARQYLDDSRPDLVLLDVGLPGEDGLSLGRYIRESLDIPIIMVSGAGDSVDRIVGLELCADDYVTKPFHPRELKARVRSVLRRCSATPGSADGLARKKPGLAGLILDREGRRLETVDGREIILTRMEFDLLCALAEAPGRVLSRDQLLNLTQNRDWDPFDRSIDIRIARLRGKLNPETGEPSLIRTVRGVGYMFVPRDG
jgi:DNA-binding response OmpR family regulator